MSLYAYNKTGAPLALAAGHPIVTLSPSAAPPAQGPSYNVTSELRPNLTVDPVNGKTGGLAASDYALLQAQVIAGSVDFEWSSDPEYLTPGLTVNGPIPGPHPIVGPDHTATGLTTGHVLRATAPTVFAFGQAQHADLGGVGANDHHNQSHVLSGGDHTESGLTAGHVLRATSATAFGWAAPVGVFDNTTRPDPTTVLVGTMIFNTDDGAPNWSNGTNWVDASGNLT